MNADGSAQTRLTNNAAFDGAPAWSPDGTKIAFASNRDGDTQIYVMNADGSAADAADEQQRDRVDSPPGRRTGTKIAFTTTATATSRST